MSLPLILSLGWLALANIVGMFPSKRNHWPQAYALIAIGLPILCWVFVSDGLWYGLVVLIAASSVLRWPVRFLMRWIARTVAGGEQA